jgi:hypothetical protein
VDGVGVVSNFPGHTVQTLIHEDTRWRRAPSRKMKKNTLTDDISTHTSLLTDTHAQKKNNDFLPLNCIPKKDDERSKRTIRWNCFPLTNLLKVISNLKYTIKISHFQFPSAYCVLWQNSNCTDSYIVSWKFENSDFLLQHACKSDINYSVLKFGHVHKTLNTIVRFLLLLQYPCSLTVSTVHIRIDFFRWFQQ